MLFCYKSTKAVLTYKTLIILWVVYEIDYDLFFHNTYQQIGRVVLAPPKRKYPIRRFSPSGVGQLLIIHAWHFTVDVNPVQHDARNPLLVAGHRLMRAGHCIALLIKAPPYKGEKHFAHEISEHNDRANQYICFLFSHTVSEYQRLIGLRYGCGFAEYPLWIFLIQSPEAYSREGIAA